MRILKKVLLIVLLLILGGIVYCYYSNEVMVPVLGYHGVLPHKLNDGNQFVMNSEDFENQLKILKKLGYQSMSLDDYYCWQRKKCKKSHRSVLITFDDGYKNNYDYAFPILKKYKMNAVVFCIGANVKAGKDDFMRLDIIKKASEEYPNIEFASHSYNKHEDRDGDYDSVNADILKMKDVIDTKYIAYPHGDYTDEYIKALKDNGYVMGFTFGPGKEHRRSTLKDNPYKIPRLNISNGMPIWKFVIKVLLPI